MYDFILQNGKVFDAATGIRGAARDIAIERGRIAEVSERIDLARALHVQDISGQMVSAGWIDIHVHAYGGIGLRDIQSVGVLAGATTVVDAGDFGTATFDDFLALTADSVAEVYGYIHMHPNGIPYTGLARADYRTIHVGAIIELVERRRNVIRGVKLGALGDLPFHNLRVAKLIAETAKVPYFMHLGEVNKAPAKSNITREAIALLRQGDIATHIYTNDNGRIIDDDGRLVPEILEAREQGVIFDVGNGVGNFSYAIAERAMDQGIFPHTISSDQNSLCGGVRSDLPETMSRFLILGMSLEDVIERVTIAPAGALGLQNVGTLAVGSKADLTVFHLDDGERPLINSDNVARSAQKVIAVNHVYKDGRYHPCDVGGIYRSSNFVMKFASPEVARSAQLDEQDRAFIRNLLRELDKSAEWRGEAIHSVINRVLASGSIERKKALGALYRLVLSEESIGFTPQLGCILARLGPEETRALHDAARTRVATAL